jgi:hypothetical protein
MNYAVTDSNSEQDQNTDITEEDIQIFKHNESVEAAITLSQEGESQHVPRIDMQFESSDEAYKFYNNYALIVGFSIVMAHNYHSRDKKMMGQVTRMTFKCQRRGIDKQQENKSSGQQRPGVQSSTASRKRKNNNINTDEAAPTAAARKKDAM